jgi:DNA segregation ATPase FtsK/SpoIIIE, S-DNA-T family
MGDQPRNRSNDMWGLALSALTLFLTLAVATNDPADPIEPPIWPLGKLYQPDATVYPTNAAISNTCGYWGALTSRALFDGFGFGTMLLLGLLGLTSFKLMTRVGIQAPVLRSLGWTLVGIAMMTAAGLAQTSAAGMPVYGGGGAIGAMTSTWLNDHFATTGSWILTLTLMVFGLLLSTDYLLVKFGQAVIVNSTKASVGGLKRAHSAARVRPSRRVTDLDDGVQLADSGTASDLTSAQPAIRIRGKNLDDGVPMVGPVLDGDKEPVSATTEPSNAVKGLAGRISSALRIGNSTEPEPELDDDANAGVEERADLREVEVAGEVKIVRKDGEHASGELKIRTPSKRKDERQELYESLQEEVVDGADDYVLPSVDLLIQSDDISYDKQADEVRRKALILEQTFKNFGFNIRVVEIETGPVIAQYEVELEAGLRLSKITGLAEDLAIALRVPSVRIVAPIPGKNTVGIEVPNETRQVVRLRDVIEECGTAARKMKIPIFLGKDVSGNSLTVDLASMPHLLIAGRTGTGKSVCLNAIISSILMTRRPDEVRMLMIDPKMVELSGYGRLPHLMHPVVTDMRKAEAILSWAVDKMEERYSLLAQVGVRHITSYNELGRDELIRRLGIESEEQAAGIAEQLPFIVIVADEIADLMMTAGKEVEQHIIRLAQKSRAVGIHLILATQKPTVDVITGLIKSNLPARISFQVASRTDSRVVLDENGADKLLGNGDMLFLWPGTSTLLRGQGTYLSDDEIERVCGYCSRGEQNFVGELMNLKVVEDEDAEESGGPKTLKNRDELYESAVDVVVREGRGSCSLLQRALGIGYGRAARLIDFMAEDGIVGQYNGSQAREVLMSIADWESMQGIETDKTTAPEIATKPAAARPKTIRRGDGWIEDDEDSTAEYEEDDAEEITS